MSERRIPRLKTESEKFSVARLTRENQHFEILIKPQKALDYRNGKISGVTEVLAAEIIFSDANKGTKVSEEVMEKIFKTTDSLKIADEILKKEPFNLQQIKEEKWLKIKKTNNRLHFSASSRPKTNLPHPPLRIENAMDQIRYSIDPYKPVEEQAKDIVKLLRPILPLKVEQIKVAIKIPTQYAARAYGAIKIFGTIKREEWRSDGSWYGELELPAGTYASLLNKLGDVTKGNGEAKLSNSKILKRNLGDYMPTFFEKKQLVTPGELLAEGDYPPGENTYIENGKIYASRIGLVDGDNKKVNVVALRAFYVPKVGDIVIGTIVEVGFNGWTVDRCPYSALLRASDVLSRPFKPQNDELSAVLTAGDLIVAKIASYDRAHDPQLTVGEPGLGKITRGQILRVTPTKIPRIIGRKGSMISMIKQETNCQIILGLNGVILVTGKTIQEEELAIEAIRKIEEESHTSGLTDRITQLLKEKKPIKVEETQQ